MVKYYSPLLERDPLGGVCLGMLVLSCLGIRALVSLFGTPNLGREVLFPEGSIGYFSSGAGYFSLSVFGGGSGLSGMIQ